jgi:hypothetical protein
VAAIKRNVDASPARNVGIAPGGRLTAKNVLEDRFKLVPENFR